MSLADVLKAAAVEPDPAAVEVVTAILNTDVAVRSKILGRNAVYTTDDVIRIGRLLALYNDVAPVLPRTAGLAAVTQAVQSSPSQAPVSSSTPAAASPVPPRT